SAGRDDRQTGRLLLPVLGEAAPGCAVVRNEHAAARLFGSPRAERDLVLQDRLEVVPLERAEHRLTRDLLPPAAGLIIAHNEVLVIDAREVKRELPAGYGRFPHQTGVAERSI